MKNPKNITRRPMKSRDTKWASAIAEGLTRAGARPNAISVAGRVNHDWHWSVLLIAVACGMQLRPLCNLFDGMVAIEGGFKTKAYFYSLALIIPAALGLISAGCLVTIFRRCARIAREMESKP